MPTTLAKNPPPTVTTENLAVAALERHAADRTRVALVWEGPQGERETVTFHDLNRRANRIANVLTGFGVGRGDRVFTLLERTPTHYAVLPGVVKTGAALGVLFSDFGAEAIRQRLGDAEARAVVTDAFNLPKLTAILHELPRLEHVLVVGGLPSALRASRRPRFHDFTEAFEQASPEFFAPEISPNDTCFIIYTSGTTGLPKGVVHRHALGERLVSTAHDVLKLDSGDLFWCTADPGWVTGLCYGTFAPWLLGLPFFAHGCDFDAARWTGLLERHQITCLYTTPTLLRQWRKAGPDVFAGRSLALNRLYSVGEPLNAEILRWAEAAFGVPVFDTYWQTETGTHLIANRPGLKVKPGSMGCPVPGVEAAVADESGREVIPGTVGSIVIRPSLISLFKGYWNFPETTQACFRNGWYVTGDRGWRDEDGYFHFVAREDDVITCAAQRIGPFEVESALLRHPAVIEAAVIGVDDPLTTQHVKAFVHVRTEYASDGELAAELAGTVREQLSPLACPREIEFCDDLPKTRTGKIQRGQLRSVGALDQTRVFLVPAES